MNSNLIKLSTFLILLFFTFSVNAVIAIKPIPKDTKTEPAFLKANAQTVAIQGLKFNKRKRMVRKYKKRVRQFIKKNNSFGNVLASRKFRLGALLLLVGILGAIAVNIFTLAQVFGWLAGAMALVGLVLMIWSLIEHS